LPELILPSGAANLIMLAANEPPVFLFTLMLFNGRNISVCKVQIVNRKEKALPVFRSRPIGKRSISTAQQPDSFLKQSRLN